MTDRQLMGPLLDALGVEVALGPHQHLTEVLVIAKVVDFEDPDPSPALAIGWSKGLDWIARGGLLEAGQRYLNQHWNEPGCTCDDGE